MPYHNNKSNGNRKKKGNFDPVEKLGLTIGVERFSPTMPSFPKAPDISLPVSVADMRMRERRLEQEGGGEEKSNSPFKNKVARMAGKKKKQLFGNNLNQGMGLFNGSPFVG